MIKLTEELKEIEIKHERALEFIRTLSDFFLELKEIENKDLIEEDNIDLQKLME